MRTMDNLSRLRGEINRIDDKILELVEERLSLCRRIALSKGNGRQLKLNPPRQRAVVERLQARASETAAPAVPHVWREIMAHGLQVQAPIRILIPVGYDSERLLRCVREQYGSAAPVDWAGLPEEAIGRAKVEGIVEVFNLFNHANYGSFVLNESNSRFGQPEPNLNVAYQPRMVQLGFRASF